MKATNRQRMLKKMLLPLIAIGMMTTMMAIESLQRARPMGTPGGHPTATANAQR